jgi:chromosome segregation ATPase
MPNPSTRTDTFPYNGAPSAALLLAVGTHSLALPGETPMSLDDRVAALTAELAEVKAGAAELRENQDDTSAQLSHIRSSLANAEIGLAALRTTTDENEARRRSAAAEIELNLTQLKDETFQLRTAQDDNATELASLRAGLANGKISQRLDAASDVTGSITVRHRHRGHRRWMSQR